MIRYFLWMFLNTFIVVGSIALWIGGILLMCYAFIGLGLLMTIAGVTITVASIATAVKYTL